VVLSEDEQERRPINYTQDFRRFAYKDFSLDHFKTGCNISPEALLKWVVAARPRNQDDVYPIMQLCKGILKDLMEEKISCRQTYEDALQLRIAGLEQEVQRRAESEAQLRSRGEELERRIEELQSLTAHLQGNVANAHAAELKARDGQIAALTARLEAEAARQAELSERAADLEKRLRSANVIAEQRAKDFFRAHNSLAARMQMTARDIVGSWGLEERCEGLRCLLQEHRTVVDRLRPADLQAMPVAAKRDLVKKLLQSIKVASPSWLKAMAEVLDCQPSELLDRVASWYERENVMTDGVKYQQQVEAFKNAIEGTDLTPLYDIFRQGVLMGRYSVAELVMSCSGKTPEETMQSMTGMSVAEVQLFREHREVILGFVQARRSVEARDKAEERQMKGLGFLHHQAGLGPAVDPMDLVLLNQTVARVFARKIAADVRHRDGREPHLNIMRTTRLVMVDTYGGGSAVKMQIAKMVRGLEVHAEAQPRLAVFRLLAGMDPARPWCASPPTQSASSRRPD
jgi:hypothetical protein